MKKILHTMFIMVTLSVIILSCGQQPEQKTAPAMEGQATTETGIKVDLASLASTDDPVCGMSLKDGIADTTTYEDKLYGFCSASCKEDFLKEPSKYLSVK